MADFPSLEPQTRTYTLGSFAIQIASSLSGTFSTVRRSNVSTGHILSLTFVSSSLADSNEIFNHYASQNRINPFDLPSEVTSGGGFNFPTGYRWIYAEPPAVNFTPGTVEVTVRLELLPPYSI